MCSSFSHIDTGSLYYTAIIFDDIIQLGKETDPGTIKDLKDTISGLIDDRVEAIGDLITSADSVSKTLTQFEKDLKTEQADLAPRLTDVQNDLAGKGGKVTQLQSEIDGIKKNIAADQKRVSVYVKCRVCWHMMFILIYHNSTSMVSLHIRHSIVPSVSNPSLKQML